MIQCRSRRAGIYKKWEERPGPAAQPGEEKKKRTTKQWRPSFFILFLIKVNLEALSYLPIISLSFSVFFLNIPKFDVHQKKIFRCKRWYCARYHHHHHRDPTHVTSNDSAASHWWYSRNHTPHFLFFCVSPFTRKWYIAIIDGRQDLAINFFYIIMHAI